MARSPSLELLKSNSDVCSGSCCAPGRKEPGAAGCQAGRWPGAPPLAGQSSSSSRSSGTNQILQGESRQSSAIRAGSCWNRESGRVQQSTQGREAPTLFHQLRGSAQLSRARLELFPTLSVHLMECFISCQSLLPSSWKVLEGAVTSLASGTAERQTHDGEEAEKPARVKGKRDKVDLWDESRDGFKYPGIRYLWDCRVVPHRYDASTLLACPLICINTG